MKYHLKQIFKSLQRHDFINVKFNVNHMHNFTSSFHDINCTVSFPLQQFNQQIIFTFFYAYYNQLYFQYIIIENQKKNQQVQVHHIQLQYIYTQMINNIIKQSYDGFQSERQESSQTIHQNHDTLQLKGLSLEFHIKYSVHSLLTHFKHILNDKGFKITQVFPNKIMLVKLTFIDRIKYIFSSKQPKRYLLTIKTQQYKNVRKVTIKKLNPYQPNIQTTTDEVKYLLSLIQNNPIQMPEPKKQQNENDDFDPCSQCEQDVYSLQATSTYMYHKIFIDQNYSIGKKMDKLVKFSKGQIYQFDKKDASLVIGALQQITEDMLMSFNCTRRELLWILRYCRETVEDYYHNRQFHLKSKQQIQYQRGQIQTEIAKRLPLTIKSFVRLIRELNSQKIIRLLFEINYIFKIQCQMQKIVDPQKISLTKKLNSIFSKLVENKIEILDRWGYPDTLYYQYLQPFIN